MDTCFDPHSHHEWWGPDRYWVEERVSVWGRVGEGRDYTRTDWGSPSRVSDPLISPMPSSFSKSPLIPRPGVRSGSVAGDVPQT